MKIKYFLSLLSLISTTIFLNATPAQDCLISPRFTQIADSAHFDPTNGYGRFESEYQASYNINDVVFFQSGFVGIKYYVPTLTFRQSGQTVKQIELTDVSGSFFLQDRKFGCIKQGTNWIMYNNRGDIVHTIKALEYRLDQSSGKDTFEIIDPTITPEPTHTDSLFEVVYEEDCPPLRRSRFETRWPAELVYFNNQGYMVYYINSKGLYYQEHGIAIQDAKGKVVFTKMFNYYNGFVRDNLEISFSKTGDYIAILEKECTGLDNNKKPIFAPSAELTIFNTKFERVYTHSFDDYPSVGRITFPRTMIFIDDTLMLVNESEPKILGKERNKTIKDYNFYTVDIKNKLLYHKLNDTACELLPN
jgi:hypothetical protein